MKKATVSILETVQKEGKKLDKNSVIRNFRIVQKEGKELDKNSIVAKNATAQGVLQI